MDFFGVSPGHGAIRVELEKRREDPVNNVAKAWRQACEKTEESFTLVHVFSGFYSSSSSRRAKQANAEFVGERFNEWAQVNRRAIRYQAVSFDFEPPPRDSDHHLADTEAKQIRDQIRRQLKSSEPSAGVGFRATQVSSAAAQALHALDGLYAASPAQARPLRSTRSMPAAIFGLSSSD